MLSQVALSVFCVGFVYFFLVTRGTLIFRELTAGHDDRSHVYWVYSNKGLIGLSDHKFFVSAVLLFQYNRLVQRVVQEINASDMFGKSLLITACAFGDVIPKIVRAAVDGGVTRVLITDIIENELTHAGGKLGEFEGRFDLITADARRMQFSDAVADINVLFFLLHELRDGAKQEAIAEAMRLVAPGGKLIIAEFHRPTSAWLRMLGTIYFTLFEPFALAIWNRFDPMLMIGSQEGWTARRTTFFFGNFQVVVATRNS